VIARSWVQKQRSRWERAFPCSVPRVNDVTACAKQSDCTIGVADGFSDCAIVRIMASLVF
jgi:hypothetical protein